MLQIRASRKSLASGFVPKDSFLSNLLCEAFNGAMLNMGDRRANFW